MVSTLKQETKQWLSLQLLILKLWNSIPKARYFNFHLLDAITEPHFKTGHDLHSVTTITSYILHNKIVLYDTAQ